MLPDEVVKNLYLDIQFNTIPCFYQAMFFEAIENVLKRLDYKIVKEND